MHSEAHPQPHDPIDPTVRPVHADGLVHGVIFGMRRDDGRWLLIRRGLQLQAAPGAVAFPGGAIEIGESPRDAVIREAGEELGIVVEPINQVWHHCFDNRPLRLFGWLVSPRSWDIEADGYEVDEVLWLNAEELADHADVLPRTSDFMERLEDAID